VKHRIRYEGASLNLLGARIIALPFLSHPDGPRAAAAACSCPRSGQPATASSSAPYYLKLAPNRTRRSRRTSTPTCCRCWRPLSPADLASAPSSSAAIVTYGSRIPIDPLAGHARRDEGIRAYLEGNGRLPARSLVERHRAFGPLRHRPHLPSPLRHFARHRLRSFVDAERITSDSYISIAGWAFQGLRVTDVAGQQPIALPAIDARWRIAGKIWAAGSSCRPTASPS
jgi:LPS-assembly protein